MRRSGMRRCFQVVRVDCMSVRSQRTRRDSTVDERKHGRLVQTGRVRGRAAPRRARVASKRERMKCLDVCLLPHPTPLS